MRAKASINRMNSPKRSHIIHQQLSTVESSQVWKMQLYDTFVFKDNLTKGEIQVKQMKRERKSCKLFRNHTKMETEASKVQDNNKQYLSNCMKMLSSTQLFQKESLKSKIFKTNLENRVKTQQQKINEVSKQNKKLRQIFKNEINKINMREFRNYMQNDNYLVDQKVMNLVRNVPTTLTKASIQRVIDISKGNSIEEQSKQKQRLLLQRNKIRNLFNSEEIKLDGEDVFIDKIINHMHSKLKDSGQYLIKPKKVAILQKKGRAMTQATKLKPDLAILNIPKLKQNEDLDRVINSLQFKRSPEIQSVEQVKIMVENKRKNIKYLTIQQEKLHSFIKHDQCSQARHLLLENASLYDTIDEKGNNLLHIAAKNKAINTFGMIAKHAKGYKLLHAQNKMKRKPLDIVAIMGCQQMKTKALQAIQQFTS